MENFNYHLPKSVGDAAKLLDAHEDAKLISGGMTLLPTLKQVICTLRTQARRCRTPGSRIAGIVRRLGHRAAGR